MVLTAPAQQFADRTGVLALRGNPPAAWGVEGTGGLVDSYLQFASCWASTWQSSASVSCCAGGPRGPRGPLETLMRRFSQPWRRRSSRS